VIVEDGFEAVAEAFSSNFADRNEHGAAVCVYLDGQPVVDLIGGTYTDDTLQLVFSTTKGVASICVAICVDRGWLSPTQTVASIWPELQLPPTFTVEQLLSHQGGLATIEPALTLEQACDWELAVKGLEGTAPLWDAGDGHGYHAVTFGWLAGELVRRADPAHRSIGRFLQDEVSGPLGLDLWIGLPDEQQSRVARLINADPSALDPSIIEMVMKVMGPGTMGLRALSMSGTFSMAPGESPWNKPETRAAMIPGANGVTNARSLARLYAAMIGEVDGTRLVSDATMRTVSAERVRAADRCLVVETAFALGFMKATSFEPLMGPSSFGHPGAGGSVAFADPDSGVAFAYVMDRMGLGLGADPRSVALVDALRTCL
jgi:CubicO group peptidase (beta-lactamase class C family)